MWAHGNAPHFLLLDERESQSIVLCGLVLLPLFTCLHSTHAVSIIIAQFFATGEKRQGYIHSQVSTF